MFSYYRKSLVAGVLLVTFSVQLNATDTKADQAIVSIGQELAGIRNALGLYCMLGMKNKYKNPSQRIRQAAEHYEKTLHQIKNDFASTDIQERIRVSEDAWAQLKPKMVLSNDKSKALKSDALFIHGHIRSVLKGLEEIKGALMKKANNKNTPHVNAAIEIGASAKRLSSHYLMKLWKLDDPTIDKHWKAGVKRYKDGIELLKTSSYVSDPTFAKKLATCEKELKFFEMMYQMGKGAPTIIDSKSNRVLNMSQEMVDTILNAK